MNALASTLYRDFICAAASLFIALVATGAFLQSTSTPPGLHADAAPLFAAAPVHGWFGQPKPAVLVD